MKHFTLFSSVTDSPQNAASDLQVMPALPKHFYTGSTHNVNKRRALKETAFANMCRRYYSRLLLLQKNIFSCKIQNTD